MLNGVATRRTKKLGQEEKILKEAAKYNGSVLNPKNIAKIIAHCGVSRRKVRRVLQQSRRHISKNGAKTHRRSRHRTPYGH